MVPKPSQETGDPEIVLGLLTSIERNSAITQRKLAGDLGIALGLANSYLRRCVRKGLIKIGQVPLNRYAYYLTPQGFAEKSRLTAEYLTVSFNFFRRARSDCAELLQECAARGWTRVALCGAGDLAEVAVLSAGESEIEVVCVIDPARAGGRCVSVPIVGDLAAAQQQGAFDGVILTDTQAPQRRFDELIASGPAYGLSAVCVVAPNLLGISRLTVPVPVADPVAEPAVARSAR
ncbi:MAG: winged helix-turn-helix transcriptional regulator [Alphaproteobacteria bacterium]|nr:MAG: winged helix-turn-helix transcriptional regulator [Alphaproteobacteria bacterium]